MDTLLGLIPALPVFGFIVLGLFGRRMTPRLAALTGTIFAGASAVLSVVVGARFIAAPPAGGSIVRTFWTWFEAGGFRAGFSLRLDALSLVFTLVVTVVGFLILVYSTRAMEGEERYAGFFAAMNLFIGSMLTLVLASNLLLLYLGWEGVGFCSYFLIGFWYKDPANGRAARKAFIVTRVGDTALAIGLFLLLSKLGTLDIAEVLSGAVGRWPVGSAAAVAAAALLLGGAVGKSAQLPLQTWLPDAMAGPTPVSALIHAATMVTAGVYLIARMDALFALAPQVRLAVAVVGAATLLLAGASALFQVDIKRVLAYSTISQVGYMFLALGAGAWPAAVFHFVTHAFFKALLFLAAGVVIMALHDEHDIFKMGGLRRGLPLVFWTFLAGAASLSALPLVTAGFYSKDWILWSAWSSGTAGPWLWAAGLLGAFLTALYAFRLVFIVFFGEPRQEASVKPGASLNVPLVVLAVLSLAAGFLETPRLLGNNTMFSAFLRRTVEAPEAAAGRPGIELLLSAISAVVVLSGLYLAYRLFLKKGPAANRMEEPGLAGTVRRFLIAGWGFDSLYETLFRRPLAWLARVNRDDAVDLPFRGIGRAARAAHALASRTQTGRLGWYAAAVAAGAVVIAALAVLL
jgi:NADH-quinone oxidoreductase subunit L